MNGQVVAARRARPAGSLGAYAHAGTSGLSKQMLGVSGLSKQMLGVSGMSGLSKQMLGVSGLSNQMLGVSGMSGLSKQMLGVSGLSKHVFPTSALLTGALHDMRLHADSIVAFRTALDAVDARVMIGDHQADGLSAAISLMTPAERRRLLIAVGSSIVALGFCIQSVYGSQGWWTSFPLMGLLLALYATYAALVDALDRMKEEQ